MGSMFIHKKTAWSQFRLLIMSNKLLISVLIINLFGSSIAALSNPLTYFCGPCKMLLEKFRCKIPTPEELASNSLKLLIQQQCAQYTAGIPFAIQLCVKAGQAAIGKILAKIKENVNTGRRLHPDDDCATMQFCE